MKIAKKGIVNGQQLRRVLLTKYDNFMYNVKT